MTFNRRGSRALGNCVKCFKIFPKLKLFYGHHNWLMKLVLNGVEVSIAYFERFSVFHFSSTCVVNNEDEVGSIACTKRSCPPGKATPIYVGYRL